MFWNENRGVEIIVMIVLVCYYGGLSLELLGRCKEGKGEGGGSVVERCGVVDSN